MEWFGCVAFASPPGRRKAKVRRLSRHRDRINPSMGLIGGSAAHRPRSGEPGRSARRRVPGSGCLQLDELPIATLGERDQLVVASLLHDAPVLKEHDLVGVGDR